MNTLGLICDILSDVIDRTAKIQIFDQKTGYYEEFKYIEDFTQTMMIE